MLPASSLHFRFFLPFIAALLAGLAIAWWTATHLMTNSLEQRLEQRLGHAATVIAEGGMPLTQELVERLARILRADILVMDSRRQIGLVTLPPEQQSLAEAVAKHWRKAATPDAVVDLRWGDESFKLVAIHLRQTTDARFSDVLLLASLGDVEQASHEAARWLGLAAAIGALIIAWLGHLAARGITRPLQRLVDGAERIAKGDRSVRIEELPPREIATLARAFNAMVEGLARFERELATRNRLAALGELAARLAHEIRNPLTAIKMQLQLLAETSSEPDRACANRLVDEIRRLELIVGGTLSQARDRPLNLGPVDLAMLVREVGELFRPHLSHHRIDLELPADATTPPIRLDADRIKQALVNLLVNARDALPEGGRIRISCDTDEQWLRLRVADSGPGIPAQDHERLLSGMGVSHKPHGLGLGLKLVKEVAQAHHGEFGITDSELGGAAITIALPLRPAPEPQ